MKKILAALLMLVMLVILAASAMAADPEIYVGGVGMASGDYLANGEATTTTSQPSGGYAYYKDGVLTLNNYSYTGAGRAMGSEGYYALVLTNKNLKLSLMGSNALMASDSSKVYGIQVTEGSSLTIEQSGTGTLMVKDAYCGIYVKGDITLNSSSVTIDNILQDGILTWGNLAIKGGKLDVDSRVRGISLGSDGKTVSIGGGEVKIVADGHGILTNLNNCAVEIKGGKTQIFGGYHGVNMSKSTLEITGGEVDIKATSTDSEKDAQYTAVNVAIFVTTGMHVRASTEPDGTLGAYVKSIHNTYDWIKVGPIPESYTVTFDSDGGSAVAAQTVVEGSKATKPADPTRSGYTFKGWTLDGTAYDFTAAVTGSITLKAKWEKDAEIWVGGVGMNSGDYLANGATAPTTTKPTTGGYAYYKDGVLTLHDYSYTGKGTYIKTAFEQRHYAAIRLKNDVKIQLDEGTENTITGTSGGESKTLVDGISYGYDIEIAGNGKLTIYGENDGAELSYSNLTVNGGDVTISGGSSGASDPTEKITVNAGSLTIKSEYLAFWAPHEFEVVLGAGITGIASESYDGSNPVAFDIDDAGDYKYVRFAKAKEYTVTVENGDGSGDYAAGETVTITAPDVSGKVFYMWTGENGVSFADKNAATTTFTMPEKNVTVTAVYRNLIDTAAVTWTEPVIGATKEDPILIEPTVTSDQNWMILEFDSESDFATWEDVATKHNTSWDGTFRAGKYYLYDFSVTIPDMFTADVSKTMNGQPHDTRYDTASGFGWIPDQDDFVSIIRVYGPLEAAKYTVTVENGDGSGDYAAGETVAITAPDVSGKIFKEWTSADGVTFADKNAATTTFTMPEKNVTVTPVYNTIISVIDLSGITPPVAGAMPDTSFTISTMGVDYGAEIFWSRYDEANNKLDQQYPDATLVNSNPFRAGMYYKLQAEVWAKEGYIFTPDTVIRYDGVELPVKDDANLKPNFRYPVVAAQRDRTAASIGWAVPEAEPMTYTVTFDSDGGSAVAEQIVTEGGTATEPTAPTKAGYTFKGWTLDGAAYDFDTPVTGDITLKATWEETPPEMTGAQFTVHKIDDEWTPLAGAEFTLYQGGAVVAVVTTEADGTALFTGLANGVYSLAETDAPEGYAATTDTCAVEIVDGSVSFDANGSDDFEIADELFVYNRRENTDPVTYTVTFDSDGGSAVAEQTVTEGGTATEPTAPTKAGYTFKGWTLDGAAYDFDTPVTRDITLKAVWEATPGVTFIVTFDANGGEGTMAPQTFADGVAQALTLNAFTRRGYSFTGWNTAADGSGMAYADGAVGVLEDNITLYAQWEQNLYPVVVTKVLEGISADHLPEGTAYHFAVIDGNNGDTQESTVITREELIEGNGKASKTIMTAYYGGMRVGEQISSAELSGYIWSAACVVTGDAEHQAMDEVYDVKGFVCSDLIMPETGEAIVTYTNEYIPAGGDLPKTGDDSHLVLWLALLGMTGAAMLMLRKKREA